MTKLLLVTLLTLSSVYGQTASLAVNQSAFPPPSPAVDQYFYDGSGNLIYDCRAAEVQPTATNFSIAAGTVTQIVVSGGTATITFNSTSYLYQSAQLQVYGSATAALNGQYRVTGVSGSTATFTTTAADGTYTDSKLVVNTWNPLLNQYVWAIKVFLYNGSNQITGSIWAGAVQPGGSPAVNQTLACSARATY